MASVSTYTDPSLVDVGTIVDMLDADPVRGLSTPEVARRLAAGGPNELAPSPSVPAWRKFLAQFHDPLIYLLFAAIGVSLVVWAIDGAAGWPVDAVVITVIVVLNAVLGFAQQARAEHAVQALAKMSAVTATVLRDGVRRRVPTAELVPGDMLVLGEGDAVAADARVLSAVSLQMSEASLTGESEPVSKSADTLSEPAVLAERGDMVFAGTAVTQGSGRAMVTATAMDTELGRIADLLHTTRQAPTPLQREMARVGRTLGIAVLVIAAVVIATTVVVYGVHSPDEVVTVLLLGVSLAVAAVPEGLPAILSVVLAVGVQRMAAQHAIVKTLSSVETLGSASVICSDKTGTLTKGEMTVSRVVTPLGQVTVTGVGYRPDGQLLHDGAPLDGDSDLGHQTACVLTGGSLAGNAVVQEIGGHWTVHGDPTEAAFLVAAIKLGAAAPPAGRFRRIGEIPFTSDRKMMTVVVIDTARADTPIVVSKGAPDVLLERCSHVQVGRRIDPLDPLSRRRLLEQVEQLSDQAFRTLAVAHRRLDPVTASSPLNDSIEHDLAYTGLVGILDPPRREAAAAIAEARRAGVRVLMITGDHPRTATRIAHDLGLVGDGSPAAVSGRELAALDAPGLRETVRRCSVYARVTPADKLRIVEALQTDHEGPREVVAMTGDGVNDAPALKRADIGIAMGRSGTEVSREAAAMILADDNFATIVRAIREGRGIFANIQKFLRYLLSSNMGEVLTVFLGVVLAGVIGLSDGSGAMVLPLLATQILWINLLTDSAPALAMGVDPDTEDMMRHPPRSTSERVIDARMWTGVVLIGVVTAAATLATVDLYLPGGVLDGTRSLDNARTAGFTVLVLAQLFNAFNARSETTTAFHRPFANRWLWAAVTLSALLQVAVVHVPVLNDAFSTEPLSARQWLVCVAMASVVLWVGELRKLILRRSGRPKPTT
ncbi:cation-translocating P-type ATPase [Rhodococcus aetherivorans]|uniref:cation-translocating P-type ATPase n=1 Tax=Rhodococcus aetherivorans TaxID=191292 RepID=UPI0038907077